MGRGGTRFQNPAVRANPRPVPNADALLILSLAAMPRLFPYRRLRRASLLPGHERRLYLADLTGVGTRKALGYLPLAALKKYGVRVGTLTAWAERHGYGWAQLREGRDCHIGSGALCIWDRTLLGPLLARNEALLATPWVPIPKEPDAFVRHIMNRTYNPHMGLPGAGFTQACLCSVYHLIGEAFGDYRYVVRPRG